MTKRKRSSFKGRGKVAGRTPTRIDKHMANQLKGVRRGAWANLGD